MGAYVDSGDNFRAYFGMRDGGYIQRINVAPGVPTVGQRIVSSVFETPAPYDMAFNRLVTRSAGVDYLLSRPSAQTLCVSAVDGTGALVPGFGTNGTAKDIALSGVPANTVVGRILVQKKGRIVVVGRVGVGSPVGQQVDGRPAITRLWL